MAKVAHKWQKQSTNGKGCAHMATVAYKWQQLNTYIDAWATAT
jgi:hypothetical protein